MLGSNINDQMHLTQRSNNSLLNMVKVYLFLKHLFLVQCCFSHVLSDFYAHFYVYTVSKFFKYQGNPLYWFLKSIPSNVLCKKYWLCALLVTSNECVTLSSSISNLRETCFLVSCVENNRAFSWTLEMKSLQP